MEEDRSSWVEDECLSHQLRSTNKNGASGSLGGIKTPFGHTKYGLAQGNQEGS